MLESLLNAIEIRGESLWAVLGRERIPNATPNKNAHIESWHSVPEAECWRNQIFDTFAEAYMVTGDWMTFYNEQRMQGCSIGPPRSIISGVEREREKPPQIPPESETDAKSPLA